MNWNPNKEKKKQLLRLAAVLIWMCVIFFLSAQPSEETSDLSGSVSYLIVSAASRILGLGWKEAKLLWAASLVEYPIRKAAHMTEYAVLTMLAYQAAGTYGCRKPLVRGASALALAFCYACTDEFHQRFVPGRAGMFTDVLIDTFGGCAGLFALFLLGKIAAQIRRKRKT